MKLIIMLICLGLERYGKWGSKLNQWRWFDPYLSWLESTVGKKLEIKDWLGTALIVLPILVAVGFVYWLLCGLFHGTLAFLFNIAILLFCLGHSAVTETKGYLAEEVTVAASATHKEGAAATVSIPAVLWEANEKLFSVLFWFGLLGPLGSLFFCLLRAVRQKAETDTAFHTLLTSAITLQELLEWLPARLISLGYGLMGNFQATLVYLRDNVLSGLSANRRILSQSGALAINLQQLGPSVNAEEIAQDMVRRTLILFMAVVAVLTLISIWL